jgi:maleylacetate reductase
MTDTFTYHSDPVRVVFGPGSVAALRAEADLHKMSRLLVLCSKTRGDMARRLVAPIAERVLGYCDTGGQSMPREAF